DAQVAVVLTESQVRERMPEVAMRVVELDSDWPQIVGRSRENLRVRVDEENPAYVMYTSGSTGRPKGILGNHVALVNRFSWMWETYPFELNDVCCQKTSLNFVDSIWEIFGSLLKGIPTIIIPDAIVKDANL